VEVEEVLLVLQRQLAVEEERKCRIWSFEH